MVLRYIRNNCVQGSLCCYICTAWYFVRSCGKLRKIPKFEIFNFNKVMTNKKHIKSRYIIFKKLKFLLDYFCKFVCVFSCIIYFGKIVFKG